MDNSIDIYTLNECLGKGQFEVWRAYNTIQRKEVALKIIPLNPQKGKKHLNMALKEAENLAKFKHNYIVNIEDARITSSHTRLYLIIAMEYIKGGSIQACMENRFLAATLVRDRVTDALFALEYVHNQGFIHGDIKPANILIEKNKPKLSDFGLCQVLHDGGICNYHSEAYTPHLPPEFYPDKIHSISTDIYAMGITLFRLVNNMNDWRERLKSINDWREKIKMGTLLKNIDYENHVPDKIRRVINKACHKDMSKRYKSAEEMRQAIDKIQPKFQWEHSDNKWLGLNLTNGKSSSIEIISKRKHKLEYRENNRKQTQYCHTFDIQKEAEEYAYKIVRETSFETNKPFPKPPITNSNDKNFIDYFK
ncbi:MAG: serine/threonine protein kinase [Alphaproteobacteria bacterium]|nr:serine/threonine protein kinase [Alphaproteobacteria bacterium]